MYFNNQNSIQFYNSLHTSSSSGKHFSPNNVAASSNRVWAACPSSISPPSSRGPPLGLPTKAHATELDILWCIFPWVRRGPHRQCPTPSVDVICHSKPRPCCQARCGFCPKRRLDLTESLPVLRRCRSTCSARCTTSTLVCFRLALGVFPPNSRGDHQAFSSSLCLPLKASTNCTTLPIYLVLLPPTSRVSPALL